MIGLIVARSKNNVIGKNVVIMGRKSYEEIGHPLPNRKNIVVSSSKNFDGDNLVTAHSLKEALELAGNQDIFIAGGYGLFKEAIGIVDKMYITEVDIEIEDGDTLFPEFNSEEFDLIEGVEMKSNIEGHYILEKQR